MDGDARRVVKYSQPVLRDILDMARRGALDELTEYIRATDCQLDSTSSDEKAIFSVLVVKTGKGYQNWTQWRGFLKSEIFLILRVDNIFKRV